MIPYIPETQPMRGEEQEALMAILGFQSWGTPSDRLRTANTIIAEGFARRIPKKVTRLQLWSYAIETIALAYCAMLVFQFDGFVFGMLVSLAMGSLATYLGGLLINHGIKTGA